MNRVLVLGNVAVVSAVETSVQGSGLQVVPLPWDAFRAETLRERAETLLVVAAEESSQLVHLRELRQTTLALVPADALCTLAEVLPLADDFAIWPCAPAELRQRILRLASAAGNEREEAHRTLSEEFALRQLVGADAGFMVLLRQIPLYARSELPILITGETGTGKELCARALHFLSARRNAPFVAADCSAIPDHLLENELFGHARGAYTDAHAEQKGLIALSEHGTLLLDEIDSLSLPAQGKLLRFLQEKTYRPLGSEKFLRADVTVLAATNRDLETAVQKKRFRADLFYRINVLQLRLPPLRDRRGDVPLLARHFLDAVCARMQTRKSFSAPALRKLAGHDWPGNVRELLNVVQRAAVMCAGELVLPCHIVLAAESTSGEPAPQAASRLTFRSARAQTLEAFERAYVKELLDRNAGNVSRAAREAGKERRAFGKLAKKYSLLPRAPRG